MHLKYLQNGRHFFRSQCVNSKWPIDAIWQHRSGSTLSQVMAVAWRHQAITWTNADLISVRSSDIHLRPISQRIPLPSVTKISSIIIYLKFHSNLPGANLLTLNVRGPSYLGLTRSISWLLMPWLLTLPGHQQPWYWLYRICRSLSYLRKDFKYLCPINVE